jgi:DNA polymerase-3 subunit delta'
MAIVRLADALGSPAAWSFLRGVVAGNRFANAYLLHGPAGVGKGTAALAFARALLCEGRAGATRGADTLFGAPEPLGPPDDACGACAACRKSGVLQHPDLRLLFPVSGEEKELDETIAGTIQSLREDQFSALLKSLEEPGASTVWVLTTSRLQRLPATIRSRCQRVRFSAWPEAELERFLGERAGIGGAPARMLAALSGGSLGKALVLRDEDAVAERNQALALLQPALTGDAAGLWRGVQTLTRFGKAGRETLRRTIEFQQLWLRDLLRARYDAPRERLVNRDREPELRAQAARLEPVEIRRRLRALEGNVTPELALFSALARAGGQRLGEGEWPAHAAARAEV